MNWLALPGLMPYSYVEDLMTKTVEAIIATKSSETVLLVEHQDVYTAGTSAKLSELLAEHLTLNIPVINVGRGGKYTYHGPGQRVIYPMLNLALARRTKDIKLYIHNLENLLINVLKQIGLKSYAHKKRIGIWVRRGRGEAKIAAIGVRIRKWVTYHGIAVNISPDLSKFSGIIPCGLADFPVTSLLELGIEISRSEFDDLLKKEFFKIFI